MEILTKRLNKLIAENKITKYRLAKNLKYSKSTILNWCDGITEPKATQIKELAVYFDVSTDYFGAGRRKRSKDCKRLNRF